MDIWMILCGFFVGILIGGTGMGGGLLITPLLIFGFKLTPSEAVGTDLIFAAVTKFFGTWQHWKQKTIDYILLKWVCHGSIPGMAFGLLFLNLIKNMMFLNLFISRSLGYVFILISIFMVIQLLKQDKKTSTNSFTESKKRWVIIAIGFCIGFLVSITSVGSGTLFMAVIFFLYSTSVPNLVGTDLLHGVIITGLAGIAHYSIGSIDISAVGNLLVGSLPGVILGSKMAFKLPKLYLQILLIIMMLVSAIKLL
jgi:uncharacterized protein